MVSARLSSSRIAAALLLPPVLAAACEDSDIRRTDMPGSAGSPAGGSGGMAGARGTVTAGAGGTEGGGADTGGTSGSGQGGMGGASSNDCVVTTLARYCEVMPCPALADAPSSLRRSGSFRAQVILQDSCVAPDGTALVRVAASYDVQLTRTLVYDAVSKELVAAIVTDDAIGCFPLVYDEAIGDLSGFYGEYLPDCRAYWGFDVPAACTPSGDAGLDASAVDAGEESADAGVLECILVR